MTADVLPWVLAYFIAGAVFGLSTFAHKHLFSEGPERPANAETPDSMNGRLVWVLVCICLWPLMALTGLYSLLRLRPRPPSASRDKKT